MRCWSVGVLVLLVFFSGCIGGVKKEATTTVAELTTTTQATTTTEATTTTLAITTTTKSTTTTVAITTSTTTTTLPSFVCWDGITANDVILQALNNEQGELKYRAAIYKAQDGFIIGYIQSDVNVTIDSKIIDTLIEALGSNDPLLRAASAQYLGWFGRDMGNMTKHNKTGLVVAALMKLSNDEDGYVRLMGYASRFKINNTDKDAFNELESYFLVNDYGQRSKGIKNYITSTEMIAHVGVVDDTVYPIRDPWFVYGLTFVDVRDKNQWVKDGNGKGIDLSISRFLRGAYLYYLFEDSGSDKALNFANGLDQIAQSMDETQVYHYNTSILKSTKTIKTMDLAQVQHILATNSSSTEEKINAIYSLRDVKDTDSIKIAMKPYLCDENPRIRLEVARELMRISTNEIGKQYVSELTSY
jgi:hypothetical protein